MSPNTLILLLSGLILLSSTTAHNITRMLEQEPDFGEFNSLLSQTKLADEINRRQTITVLAVANGGLGNLNGKPQDVQKRILSNHIVLDYYDQVKLENLKENKTTLTTLFQSTGIAQNQQGFLNVVHNLDKSISFGSAVEGAQIDANLLNSVAKLPFNISVLRISHLIVAPGIDGPVPPMHAPAPRFNNPNDNVPPPAGNHPTHDDEPSQPSAEGPGASGPPVDQQHRNGAGKLIAGHVSLGSFIVALASFLAAAAH